MPSQLAHALLPGPDAEDESIKDLRRALIGAGASPAVRKAATPPELRPAEALLHPDLGRALQDVAQPGGFRRHHVRRNSRDPGLQGAYALSALVELLRPEVLLPSLEPSDDEAPCEAPCHASVRSSNLVTAVILVKCCFGAAFLIVPNGMKMAGVLGGPLCLVVVYALLLNGMLRLIDCRRARGESARFADLGSAWGPWGKAYITGGVMLLSFGFNCVWCVTCAENLSMIMTDWSPTLRLFVFLPVVALLSLVRRLKFFTVTNLVGIVLCATTALYLFYLSSERIARDGPQPVILFSTSAGDTALWVGACGYIFELICSLLPIYEAAADKDSVPKLLVCLTMGILGLYLCVGLTFYAAFGDATANLATLNLPTDSLAGKLFPLLFALVGVVTIPINSFSIYQCYEPCFVWSEHYTVRKWKKNAVRVLVVCLTYGVTWLGGSQLQNFLALVGGLLGANLSMMVPCGLHLAICKPTGIARLGDIITMLAGLAMMLCSTYQALATWRS